MLTVTSFPRHSILRLRVTRLWFHEGKCRQRGLTLYDHMIDNHKTVLSPSNEGDISNNSCSTHLIAVRNQMWRIDGNLVGPRAFGAKGDLLLMDYY